MSENLRIFGKDHANVDGFKVQDTSGNWLIYEKAGSNVLGITQDQNGYLIVDENPYSGGGGGGLPPGYTQLDYVESSGTQIIDTGLSLTIDTRIEIACYFLAGTYGAYLHTTGSHDPSAYIMASNNQNAGDNRYWGFGSRSDFAHFGYNVPTGDDAYTENCAPHAILDKNGATIVQLGYASRWGGIGTAPTLTPSSEHIGIFGLFDGTTPFRCSPLRFFRERIWDGTTLLRDFVPAMENSTQEIGLFDIVNDVFYRNQGTGVFVGGTV